MAKELRVFKVFTEWTRRNTAAGPSFFAARRFEQKLLLEEGMEVAEQFFQFLRTRGIPNDVRAKVLRSKGGSIHVLLEF